MKRAVITISSVLAATVLAWGSPILFREAAARELTVRQLRQLGRIEADASELVRARQLMDYSGSQVEARNARNLERRLIVETADVTRDGVSDALESHVRHLVDSSTARSELEINSVLAHVRSSRTRIVHGGTEPDRVSARSGEVIALGGGRR